VIRFAHAGDAPAILAINAASQPHVARLDAAELARLLALASVFLVVESPDVIAYLIAMRSTDDYDGEEFTHFKAGAAEPFLYIDQIAIAPPSRGRGLGRALYAHAKEWCREHDIVTLCCEVNLEPPNPDSLIFHERIGFRRSGEMHTRDGRRVVLLTHAVCRCPQPPMR
jgi:predicted GNAT superfamily acetyltransferase